MSVNIEVFGSTVILYIFLNGGASGYCHTMGMNMSMTIPTVHTHTHTRDPQPHLRLHRLNINTIHRQVQTGEPIHSGLTDLSNNNSSVVNRTDCSFSRSTAGQSREQLQHSAASFSALESSRAHQLFSGSSMNSFNEAAAAGMSLKMDGWFYSSFFVPFVSPSCIFFHVPFFLFSSFIFFFPNSVFFANGILLFGFLQR
ncbi:hypothetical protein Avbf_13757 [Armadillidium vulgare]|nr:hypothetical protein Avbf_13757 [Armadillidium vulgare]